MTIKYHIADEEGYIYLVSDALIKEAIKVIVKTNDIVDYISIPKSHSIEIANYLGEKLDHWKELPILTSGKNFSKVGHILTTRR